MSGTTPTSEVNDLRHQLEALRASDPVPHVEAAKQQVGDTVSHVAAHASAKASDVASQAAGLASQAAEAVAQPVRQGMETARAAVAGVKQTAAQANEHVDNLGDQIRTAPVLSLALAALGGYVIGRIVR